jgi:hypothetical protein
MVLGKIGAMVFADSNSLQSILAALPVLFGALEAEVLSLTELKKCSDRMIQELESVPIWLVDLDDANTTEMAKSAIAQALHETDQWSIDNDPRTCLLGFLYMKFKAGQISLRSLLHTAGLEADKKNLNEPSCEAFFLLLGSFERADSDLEKARVSDAADNLFLPFLLRLQDYIRQNLLLKDVRFLS